MAKKKRSWSGWSPNITSSGVTGGTAYAPSPSGSFSPGAPSGAAPSSAPASITPTQSKPVDSNFKDAQYVRETGDITYGLGRGISEFGANTSDGGSAVKFDEKGNPIIRDDIKVDWSNPDGVAKLNPFSRAALLIKSYQQGVQGTSNSYAARGQHSSGAYQRAQNSNQTGFEQGRSGIDNALRDFLRSSGSQFGAATEGAILRGEQKVVPTVDGSAIPAVGTATYGNVGAAGAPSANSVLSDWGKRPDAYGNKPTGLNGAVQLANGWTMVYVNGKPQFIPPGGKVK